MNNQGVMCDVCECCHNVEGEKCDLQKIEVTHETSAANAVASPHFCKSFEQK